MRGVTTLFAVFALGGLAACNGEPITINPIGSSAMSERQTECYENQLKAADYTLPSFERERARDRYNQKDCVYQSPV